MGEAAMAQLDDMDFFVTLDPESNSVAALVKHIAGNARSRFTGFLGRVNTIVVLRRSGQK
jgi:hypothetical protein